MTKRSRIQQRAPIGANEDPGLQAAFGVAQRRLRELGKERRATRLEIAELRQVIADQTKQIEALTSKVESVTNREEELRAMLLGAHDQLMRRAEKIKADLYKELQPTLPRQDVVPHPDPEVPEAGQSTEWNAASGTHTSLQQSGAYLDYPLLVGHIQEVAKAVLPQEATVAVVSKGDEELLRLDGERSGWHFPQNEDGIYAGYYPVDSFAAISHLEELRSKGADFLLFPATAFWWLERYDEFARHLDACYRRIWGEGCIIYELHSSGTDGAEIRRKG